jgi:NAD+ kinase
MRFGFLLKRGKPEARQTAALLVKLLAGRGFSVVVTDDEEDLPGTSRVLRADFGRHIDALVVLGGDGTFLHGAGLVSDDGVPVLGINMGSLGFMTHYTLAEAEGAVLAAAEGRLPIDERMRLRVAVRSGGHEVAVRNALNEAAITQLSMVRLLDLTAYVDDEVITTFKADGLIVASPTGSTAYSLAAGGPILTPDLEALALVPICPHTLTNRPVVLRADRRLRVTNESPYAVSLTVDGQWNRELLPGDEIEVVKAPRPLRTYRAPGPFFAILRQKLRWGEREI